MEAVVAVVLVAVAVVAVVEEEKATHKAVVVGAEVVAAPRVVEWKEVVAIRKAGGEVEKVETPKVEAKKERTMNTEAKKMKCSVKILMRMQLQRQLLLCSH